MLGRTSRVRPRNRLDDTRQKTARSNGLHLSQVFHRSQRELPSSSYALFLKKCPALHLIVAPAVDGHEEQADEDPEEFPYPAHDANVNAQCGGQGKLLENEYQTALFYPELKRDKKDDVCY